MNMFFRFLILSALLIPSVARAADCSVSNRCLGGMVQITSSTGTTQQTIYTSVASSSGGNGAIIEAVKCSPTVQPSGNLTFLIEVSNGTYSMIESNSSMYATSGVTGSNGVQNMLNSNTSGQVNPPTTGWPTDTLGNTYIMLPPGWTLTIGLSTGISGSGVVECVAEAKQY